MAWPKVGPLPVVTFPHALTLGPALRDPAHMASKRQAGSLEKHRKQNTCTNDNNDNSNSNNNNNNSRKHAPVAGRLRGGAVAARGGVLRRRAVRGGRAQNNKHQINKTNIQ